MNCNLLERSHPQIICGAWWLALGGTNWNTRNLTKKDSTAVTWPEPSWVEVGVVKMKEGWNIFFGLAFDQNRNGNLPVHFLKELSKYARKDTMLHVEVGYEVLIMVAHWFFWRGESIKWLWLWLYLFLEGRSSVQNSHFWCKNVVEVICNIFATCRCLEVLWFK